MIKKYIGAGLVALGLLLSVGSIAAPAQASSLTSTQISAIIGLLQSFGADQGTINNVSADLGGSSSSLSCSSFADLTYGSFDNNPGGRVSQLQTWLGISSNTFGFGTYGNKTQAAWNAKCGGTQTTTSTAPNTNTNTAPANTQTGTQNTSANFTATPTSGIAPLSVTFTSPYGSPSGTALGYVIDFGDGTQQSVTCSPVNNVQVEVQSTLIWRSVCENPVQITHTYPSSGTYTAVLYSGKENEDSWENETTNITVTGGNSNNSVSLTASPTSGVEPLTVNFSTNAQGTDYALDFGDGAIGVSVGVGDCGVNRDADCGASHTYTSPGTYIARIVQDSNCSAGKLGGGSPCVVPSNAQTLTSQTITVTGSNSNNSVSLTASPTSGVAPLSVSFSFPANAQINLQDVGIDFGDATPPSGFNGLCGGLADARCGISHTYTDTLPGTYTAKLISGANCGNESNKCTNLSNAQTISTAKVTVTGGSIAESFSASQTSGSAPLEVTFKGIVSCSDVSGLTINYGDGVSGGGYLSSVCTTGISGTHNYANAGVYTASLYTGTKTIGSVTINVSPAGQPSAAIDQSSLTASTNYPITISGTASGVTALYLAVSDLNGNNAFASDTLTVHNGIWSGTLPKSLANGSYKVSAIGPGYVSLASGTLTVSSN